MANREKGELSKQLKAKKKELNERVKLLRKLLVATQKGVNGKPSPDIHISEKTPLDEPLPSEISLARSVIDARTREVIRMIEEIERNQQKVSEAGLSKEASNIFTRLLAKVKAPFLISEKDRWKRLEMLRNAAEINRLLKDLEQEVVSSRSDNLFKISNMISDLAIRINNDLLYGFSSMLRDKLEEISPDLDIVKKEEKRLGLDKVPVEKGLGIRTVEERDGSGDSLPEISGPVIPIAESRKAQKHREYVIMVYNYLSEIYQNLKPSERIQYSEDFNKHYSQSYNYLKQAQSALKEKNLRFVEIMKSLDGALASLRSAKDELSRILGKYNGTLRDFFSRFLRKEEDRGRDENQYIREQARSGSDFLRQIKDGRGGHLFMFGHSSSKFIEFITNALNYISKKFGHEGLTQYDPRAMRESLSYSVYNYKPQIDASLSWLLDHMNNFQQWTGKADEEDTLEEDDINQAIAFYESAPEDLKKFASTALSRALSRFWLGFSGKKDRTLRQIVDRAIRDGRSELNKLMNELERSDVSQDQLLQYTINFAKNMIIVYERIAKLSEMYNNGILMSKHDSKSRGEKPEFPNDTIRYSEISALRRSAQEAKELIERNKKYQDALSRISRVSNAMGSA